ncbi:hypothetical protein [Alteromonas stellipolaris]|uniref:hypothetical protein n=1 Tax=Alteromonas stellipolaris TaxID=233316 RepID=UPI002732A911|nr:hypothetical protein [Alteromonas stellipolaris]MDP2595474.1 hypothetical protein [Alteromonas stellipolaris]
MEDIRGNLETYMKEDIALQYLTSAIDNYIAGENLFVVIHLASAAEEMLGKLVRMESQQSSLERTQNWFKSWYSHIKKDQPSNSKINKFVLRVKNGIKHIDGEKDLEIELDIQRESHNAILRALENLNHLPRLKDPLLENKFYRHKRI